MINSRYTFTLDMHSTISQVSLPVRQFDDSIELRITLTSGGTPYYIEDGCRAVFVGRRSNDEPLLNDCRIEKNTTIYYKLTEQTTGIEGVVDCEIRLYGTDNNVLTSPRFILVVNNRVAKTSDFESKIETDALDNIFKNETAREDAERQREIAEAEREVTYKEMLDTVREASEVADTLSEKLATGDYNGQNGLTPFIGANGNWWIGDEDTGVLADGFSIPLRTGSGENSVEQIGCEAREENSVALGEGTIASARGQFVAGRYNKENPNALLIVGNGTSKDNPSNSVEVLKDGTLVGDGVLQMAMGTFTVAPSMSAELHFDFYPRILITDTGSGYTERYIEENKKVIYFSHSELKTVRYIAIGNTVPYEGNVTPTTTFIVKDTSGKILIQQTTDVVNPYVTVTGTTERINDYYYNKPIIQFNGKNMISGTLHSGIGSEYNTYSLSIANDGNATSEGDLLSVTERVDGYYGSYNSYIPVTVSLTVGKTHTYYLIKGEGAD